MYADLYVVLMCLCGLFFADDRMFAFKQKLAAKCLRYPAPAFFMHF